MTLSTLNSGVEDYTEGENRQVYEQCAERSGGADVLAHVGTRDVARDMDVLRAVLGDEKLSFLGQSYGTRLGAIYAETFPQNVRALVLDAALDPVTGTTERRLIQFAGFQNAFDNMAAFCAKSMYDDFAAGVEQAAREFDMPRPPVALIGVDILFEEGILIEAEVTAVIDRIAPTQTPTEVPG